MKAVSSHLVGVAVALGLLAPSPHILAADINYLPDDTVLVAAVNLKQIFDSEMLKRQPDAIGEMKEVLRHFAGIQTVQKYLRECGLDAFKHVKIITYVYTGSTSPKLSFVILDGTFDTATFADNSNGIRRRNSGKTPVYEITPRGEQTFHVVLVNATTIIAASDAASIDEALARSAGSKKSGLKKEMQSWLTSFDDRRSISFVSTGAA
ncbi:MAG TPA: hypothetical protein VLM40_15085, partial [Gemmata sp.]|nr:hypothetical protein [Gemmata sp.]